MPLAGFCFVIVVIYQKYSITTQIMIKKKITNKTLFQIYSWVTEDIFRMKHVFGQAFHYWEIAFKLFYVD